MGEIIILTILIYLFWNRLRRLKRNDQRLQKVIEEYIEKMRDTEYEISKELPGFDAKGITRKFILCLGYLIYGLHIVLYFSLALRFSSVIFMILSAIQIITVGYHMRHVSTLADYDNLDNFEDDTKAEHLFNVIIDLIYYPMAIVLLIMN